MVALISKDQAVPRSPVAVELGSCWWAFLGLSPVSGVINLLTLTGSLFMQQTYDCVLSGCSVPTLAAIAVVAAVAYQFQVQLELMRSLAITWLASGATPLCCPWRGCVGIIASRDAGG
jgi:ABC-type protease/lipase transport system fused ATPase/permease subunit